MDLPRSTRETSFSSQEPSNMVRVPGGQFTMGSNHGYPEESPAHVVNIDSFWMDCYLVTNAEFELFVNANSYITLAERILNQHDYPSVSEKDLVPGSAVFMQPENPTKTNNYLNWWQYIPGACWRHPGGPKTSISGLEHHPVVHVAYEDAKAYANWLGKTLPTEAQWERAARGGMDGCRYIWGDEPIDMQNPQANIWHGQFPCENLKTSQPSPTPVGEYPANNYGLYDMAGNVWEWTQDWYHSRHEKGPCCAPKVNPRGPEVGEVNHNAVQFPLKVIKGGSYLCADNYCHRYRPAARAGESIDSSTCHIGFRCVNL